MSCTSGEAFEVDLSTPQSIHIVAIGGAGMSGIATILHESGHRVTGSDRSESPFLIHLRELGIPVVVGTDSGNARSADLVAISVAIPETDPDVIAARSAGVPVVRRTEILRSIASARRTIAVAGTHGKSSTTAMLAVILKECNCDVGYLVGATVAQLGSNASAGSTGEFIVEADESDRSFLALLAYGAIVTNIEADHLDVYGSFEAVVAAFGEFVDAVRGPLLMCADDTYAMAIAAVRGCETYGESANATFIMAGFTAVGLGSRFSISDTTSGASATVDLSVPGRHMALNAVAAIAMATRMGVPLADAARAAGRYRGIGRRFEAKGILNGVTFYDDYAHMPAELAANLRAIHDAVGENFSGKIVAVFQPHLYSRTFDNAAGFAASLALADFVVLAPIYGAREAPVSDVTSGLIATLMGAETPVLLASDRGSLAESVRGVVRPGDICITFGAGDITTLYDELKELE